jgi:hypothetical protein
MIESLEGEMFRVTRPTQPPVRWVSGLSQGKEAEVKKGFELRLRFLSIPSYACHGYDLYEMPS